MAAGLVLLAPQVRADGPSWGVSFGVGFGGAGFGGFVGHGHRVHAHRPFRPAVIVAPPPRQIPIYSTVWVPARYEQVFAGYDRCGRPVYRTVCVGVGHYERVITGYRTC